MTSDIMGEGRPADYGSGGSLQLPRMIVARNWKWDMNFFDKFERSAGVFRGGACARPPPFGRTAVIFVTILDYF